jgi:hypothetical protein
MYGIPNFVSRFLIRNNRLQKDRFLIIGENYPGATYNTYFYRSLLPAVPVGGNPFFTALCAALQIPTAKIGGTVYSEFERLKCFLNFGYLVIDALPGGGNGEEVAPVYPIAAANLDDLIDSILLINPEKIIILTKAGNATYEAIATHPEGAKLISRILTNPITGKNVFAFPSFPANPSIFQDQIDALDPNTFL